MHIIYVSFEIENIYSINLFISLYRWRTLNNKKVYDKKMQVEDPIPKLAEPICINISVEVNVERIHFRKMNACTFIITAQTIITMIILIM